MTRALSSGRPTRTIFISVAIAQSHHHAARMKPKKTSQRNVRPNPAIRPHRLPSQQMWQSATGRATASSVYRNRTAAILENQQKLASGFVEGCQVGRIFAQKP